MSLCALAARGAGVDRGVARDMMLKDRGPQAFSRDGPGRQPALVRPAASSEELGVARVPGLAEDMGWRRGLPFEKRQKPEFAEGALACVRSLACAPCEEWFEDACSQNKACQGAFRKMLFGLFFFHGLIQDSPCPRRLFELFYPPLAVSRGARCGTHCHVQVCVSGLKLAAVIFILMFIV